VAGPAIVLNLAEVFLRKWRGLMQALRELRPGARATAA
jgi:hypothetical protein